ncbi:MAG: cation-translocating P-type ATPase [Sphingobacteriales bacterium]|nr:cation-translocating P-type ATPase [Sphingobacteriales bacterium]OJY88834.1 MAG: haloacid dehalogenase [Sphingobacteriales bacterium 44-15]
MEPGNFNDIKGLSDEGVSSAARQYGFNQVKRRESNTFLELLLDLLKEPMVILLLVTSTIYFITGNKGDAIFLAVSIVFVTAISIFQDRRSRSALQKLKALTAPESKVIRNGKVISIRSEDIVMGDYMVIEEGSPVAADGQIIHSNDFSVNESLLTGESLPVYKDSLSGNNHVYQGTIATGGLAVATVTAIGNHTRLGQIGASLQNIKEEKTPLQLQIKNFVRKMVFLGIIIFLVVWGINFYRSREILDSLLKALALAMSILPEEIPVAFTTFMALGAWRLMKMGIIVRQMNTVETLGSATVICVDKTGTITENKMTLAGIYTPGGGIKIIQENDSFNEQEHELLTAAMWASEPVPFDPMETTLHRKYEAITAKDERSQYQMIHEYPLSGKPPMMTHIFENREGIRIIAAKGAPEALIEVSRMTAAEKEKTLDIIKRMADEGFRLLGVAVADFAGTPFPADQYSFSFRFKGIVAFYDPPKQNIHKVFNDFYNAGIKVKIVTGDNKATTVAIAKQVGLRGIDGALTGDELLHIGEEKLNEAVKQTNIFARMFPEAKVKVINSLKAQQEIVAMTGDGVNDGPALKAAHIGIAMGKKGTEIAKTAASLILVNDDLSGMVSAVAMGRRIYGNLKKAIQYIISIHIPIILTVFLPLALGWVYPNIFSPVHIIFLELIMGPTCSIIYENEPMERNTMKEKPRPFTTTFFNWNELATSVMQGLMISAGTMITYQYAVHSGAGEDLTRAMVFTALITANIILTLINRSFFYSIFTTLRYKNPLVLLIIYATIALSVLILFVNPFASFFRFDIMNVRQTMFSIATGFVSVIWFEGIKWNKRRKSRLQK